jgi:hypothetical protein
VYKLNGSEFSCNGLSTYFKVHQYQDIYGRTVILLPMMHIGSAKYYKEVDNILNQSNLILAEGVSDRHNILEDRQVNYKMIADLFGFVCQKRFKFPSVVNADGDVSDLKPETQKMLTLLVKFLNSDKGLVKSLNEFKDGLGESNIKNLHEDLLEGRNLTLEECFNSIMSDQRYIREKLKLDEEYNRKEDIDYSKMFDALEQFQQIMPREQIITIPWGAKHMEHFHPMLKQMGFKIATKINKHYTIPNKVYVFSLLNAYIHLLFSPARGK